MPRKLHPSRDADRRRLGVAPEHRRRRLLEVVEGGEHVGLGEHAAVVAASIKRRVDELHQRRRPRSRSCICGGPARLASGGRKSASATRVSPRVTAHATAAAAAACVAASLASSCQLGSSSRSISSSTLKPALRSACPSLANPFASASRRGPPASPPSASAAAPRLRRRLALLVVVLALALALSRRVPVPIRRLEAAEAKVVGVQLGRRAARRRERPRHAADILRVQFVETRLHDDDEALEEGGRRVAARRERPRQIGELLRTERLVEALARALGGDRIEE